MHCPNRRPSRRPSRSELRSVVGRYLGYGPGPAFGGPAWTEAQAAIIDRIVEEALETLPAPS